MSDSESDLPYCVDRARTGRAACKGCKQKCLVGELRLARLQASPYGEGKKMKAWYHVPCLMTAFLKQRPTTSRLRGGHEVEGWGDLTQQDQQYIIQLLTEMEQSYREKHGDKAELNNKAEPVKKKETKQTDVPFKDFRKLCAQIADEDAYLAKTACVHAVLHVRVGGSMRTLQELSLWCRLLLPGAVRRVYNLRSKQIVKLMSRLLQADREAMLQDLQQGDVAETVCRAHLQSTICPPCKVSNLTCREVDQFLNQLCQLTKEDDQIHHFRSIITKCTANDLKMIIRLIKCDLRINAGPKHILEGVHPDAYTAFQTCRDIDTVLERILGGAFSSNKEASTSTVVPAEMSLMLPVLPMLAEACTSVEMAMAKCPNGMFSEIKYDGERVQVHKQGTDFKYFSRALKPVMAHKIERFREFIPQAFPRGEDLVLDAEVLMVDTRTGKPLPFGTLGVHKRDKFSHAEVCLVVFDCIHYNGRSLLDRPLHERRQVLLDNMKEITNHVVFSEMHLIRKQNDLVKMILKVLEQGLEGLVLKDIQSVYTPGKRRWLKVKRDYLLGGSMADTADLLVLGAWYGTGKKGGMLSVFLMGCWDKISQVWCTVTKVHTGLDDMTLAALQEPLMTLMEPHPVGEPTPAWLKVKPNMVPDMLAKNPQQLPVWEITGTEFTRANIHTADGISVRFPRITRRREDKTWKEATTLEELKTLFQNSRDNPNLTELRRLVNQELDEEEEITHTKISETQNKRKVELNLNYEIDNKKLKTKVREERVDQEEENKKTSGIKKTIQNTKRITAVDDKIDTQKLSKTKVEPHPISNISFLLSPSLPLPVPFSGCHLSFCPLSAEADFKVALRHWLSFGGVYSQRPQSATHIVHMGHKRRTTMCETYSNTSRHVSVSWLNNCLRHRRLFDPKCYTIFYT